MSPDMAPVCLLVAGTREKSCRIRQLLDTQGRLASVGVGFGGLKNRAHTIDLSSHEGLVTFWCDSLIGHDQSAKPLLFFNEFRVLEGALQGIVDLLGDRRWRSFGRIQAVPDRQVEVL